MYNLIRPVLYICGMLLGVMALLMMVPVLAALTMGEKELWPFLWAAVITVSLGFIMTLSHRGQSISLNSRQLYLLTTTSWIALSFAGALPFIFCREHLTLTNAVFESVSGLTTTGSTVLVHIDTLPRSILLWRSLLQWIGGIGVIGMAVSIMPFLKVGGMRLFRTESSDWSEKTLPRFQSFALTLVACYVVITVLCGLSYWLAGVPVFESVNLSMATISTGGFATSDDSFGHYGLAVLWVATLFMLMGALPFTLFVRLVVHRSGSGILMDEQAKGFLLIVGAIVLVLTIHLIATGILPPFSALTHAAFNVSSIITTTGFASSDYTLWGEFSISLFFMVTFIGGCSGSTAGGMKIFRFQLSFMFLMTQLRKLVHPRGIFTIRYGGKLVEEDIMSSAVAFSFMFFVALALFTLILTAMGLDFVTAFTGTATALTNVGPGLGEMIGPAGNFAELPVLAKWVLAFAMVLGRLELLTVAVLFSKAFWRS
jgi:trk system potassium uptake protein TrkH